MTLRKAVIQNLDSREQIEVMYNPVEYTSTTEMVTSRVGATVQFQRLESPNFSVNLFFDTYERGTDVRNLTRKIAAFQEPTVGNKEQREPPVCLFSWGGFQYTGIIRKLDQRFTMFLPSGIPVRAELAVTFEQVVTPRKAIENAGLDNCRKMYIVCQGDRLDLIAFRELGDANAWPRIASLNGIADPLIFPTREQIGTTLIIPDPGEPSEPRAASQAGRLDRPRSS